MSYNRSFIFKITLSKEDSCTSLSRVISGTFDWRLSDAAAQGSCPVGLTGRLFEMQMCGFLAECRPQQFSKRSLRVACKPFRARSQSPP